MKTMKHMDKSARTHLLKMIMFARTGVPMTAEANFLKPNEMFSRVGAIRSFETLHQQRGLTLGEIRRNFLHGARWNEPVTSRLISEEFHGRNERGYSAYQVLMNLGFFPLLSTLMLKDGKGAYAHNNLARAFCNIIAESADAIPAQFN